MLKYKLLTSLDPEKIAQHIDQTEECSFVFFNLGTAKNCSKICDEAKFGWCVKWRLFKAERKQRQRGEVLVILKL